MHFRHVRVDILIYLNRNWEQDWGGDIELWNNNTLQKASYAPLFNRTLIFPTTTDTLHGHPVRLTCPKDRSRRLILIYYWSAIPSDDKKAQPLRWYSGEPDTWEKNFELWEKNFESTISAISNLIPRYDTFVLVDDGKLLSDDRFADYNVIPFLEKDGKYFGAPPDDATAISEFERVRGLNASFIVFAWPAFWWLTHYTKFHQHLRAKFPCVLENDSHMIFDLCP